MNSFKNIMNSLLQSSSEGVRRPLCIISEAALRLSYQYEIFEKLCPEFVYGFCLCITKINSKYTYVFLF